MNIFDLDIKELEESCNTCKGTGYNKYPQYKNMPEGYRVPIDMLDEDGIPMLKCWACDGKRIVLTPKGTKVMETFWFIQRHLSWNKNG